MAFKFFRMMGNVIDSSWRQACSLLVVTKITDNVHSVVDHDDEALPSSQFDARLFKLGKGICSEWSSPGKDDMESILVIEDNQDIRENTCEILEMAGYTTISAANGQEGIHYAIQSRPNIILCDILMPEISGYDVIRILKNDPLTSQIPFVYVTASGEKNEIALAMDMGAVGYVRKPFEVGELINAIHKALVEIVSHQALR